MSKIGNNQGHYLCTYFLVCVCVLFFRSHGKLTFRYIDKQRAHLYQNENGGGMNCGDLSDQGGVTNTSLI